MSHNPRTILVTGGCGFIGSNLIRFLFRSAEFSGSIINLDKLTYAGNPLNLRDIEQEYGDGRYSFVHGDVADADLVGRLMRDRRIDTVVHLAAESHVDRSILGPEAFLRTNVSGTFSLLEACRAEWSQRAGKRFHHVSTDEVYGSLEDDSFFTEETPYAPRSPYSASKAASDHFVRAYYHTYDLPVTISNCSNNYGPMQFPEKLIPLMILRMLEGDSLPVYGCGKNIRDWLHVADHCRGIWDVLVKGVSGESYNFGADAQMSNLELLDVLAELVASRAKRTKAEILSRIEFVQDRPGHDMRYAIDPSKAKARLGWSARRDLITGLKETVDWYIANPDWVAATQSGDYQNWLESNYSKRERGT